VELDGFKLYMPVAFVPEYMTGHEPITTTRFRQAIKPGSTVVDVGANVGYFTLVASRLTGASGTVIAFEPDPFNFELLCRNVKINGASNVVTVQSAVSDRPGASTMLLGNSSDHSSLFPHPVSAPRSTISVDCVSLDSYFNGRVADVIKMDVEGAEPLAIAGARETIAAARHLDLFIELNPACLRLADTSPEQLLSLLNECGETLWLLDEQARRVTPIDAEFRVDESDPGWFANVHVKK
jgi:FkbM family methyltransferase